MSNWVRDNPTRSLVIYTITIIASVWAVFTLILDKNRERVHSSQITLKKIELKKAELENQQLNSKIGVLEQRIIEQNGEINNLNSIIENTPTIQNSLLEKNKALTTKLERLEEKIKTQENIDGKYENDSGFIAEGSSYMDKKTKVSIGVFNIDAYDRIEGNINLPKKGNISFEEISPGYAWDYEYNGVKYKLILVTASYSYDRFRVKVIELEN